MKVITIIAAAVAASVSNAHPVPRPGEQVRASHRVVSAPNPNPPPWSRKDGQAWNLVLTGCQVGNHSDFLAKNCTDKRIHAMPVHFSPDAQEIEGLYDEITKLTQLEGTSTWLYMPGQPPSRPVVGKRGEEAPKPTIPPHGMPDRSHLGDHYRAGGGWFVETSRKLHVPHEQWDDMIELRLKNVKSVSPVKRSNEADNRVGMKFSKLVHKTATMWDLIDKWFHTQRFHESYRIFGAQLLEENRPKISADGSNYSKVPELPCRIRHGNCSNTTTSNVDSDSLVPRSELAGDSGDASTPGSRGPKPSTRGCLKCTGTFCSIVPCQLRGVDTVNEREKYLQLEREKEMLRQEEREGEEEEEEEEEKKKKKKEA